MLYYKNSIALLRAIKNEDENGDVTYNVFTSGKDSKFICTLSRDEMKVALERMSLNHARGYNTANFPELPVAMKVDIVDFTLTSDGKIFPSGERKMNEYREDKSNLADRIYSKEQWDKLQESKRNNLTGNNTEVKSEQVRNLDILYNTEEASAFLIKYKGNINNKLSYGEGITKVEVKLPIYKIGGKVSAGIVSPKNRNRALMTSIYYDDAAHDKCVITCEMHIKDTKIIGNDKVHFDIGFVPYLIETDNYNMIYRFNSKEYVKKFPQSTVMSLDMDASGQVIKAEIVNFDYLKNLNDTHKEYFSNVCVSVLFKDDTAENGKGAGCNIISINYSYDGFRVEYLGDTYKIKMNSLGAKNSQGLGESLESRYFNNIIVERELNADEVNYVLQYFEECIDKQREVPEGLYSAIKYGIKNRRDYIREACELSYRSPKDVIDLMNRVKVGPINAYTNKSFFTADATEKMNEIKYVYDCFIAPYSDTLQNDILDIYRYKFFYKKNESRGTYAISDISGRDGWNDIEFWIEPRFRDGLKSKWAIKIKFGKDVYTVNGDVSIEANTTYMTKPSVIVYMKPYEIVASDKDKVVFSNNEMGNGYDICHISTNVSTPGKFDVTSNKQENYRLLLDVAKILNAGYTASPVYKLKTSYDGLGDLYHTLCQALTDENYRFEDNIEIRTGGPFEDCKYYYFNQGEDYLSDLYNKASEYVNFCRANKKHVPIFLLENASVFKRVSEIIEKENKGMAESEEYLKEKKKKEKEKESFFGIFSTIKNIMR